MNRKYMQYWLHFVWYTKYGEPFLNRELQQKLFPKIKEICYDKGYDLSQTGGYHNHIYMLIRFNPDQCASVFIKDIKGTSSRWINKNHFTCGKFAWQRGFGVFSVSYSKVNVVRNYIRNQWIIIVKTMMI